MLKDLQGLEVWAWYIGVLSGCDGGFPELQGMHEGLGDCLHMFRAMSARSVTLNPKP